MTVRVFVVDDQPLIRSGLRMVLGSQPDVEVVGESGDGADAVRRLTGPARVVADVVLVDVRMPGLDGIEVTRRLLAAPGGERLRVVVLTTFDVDEHAHAALRAGASGFLLKSAPPETLVAAVRTVHEGDAVIAPSTTRRMLDALVPRVADPRRLARRREAAGLVARLTPREREVLLLMASGRSNGDIRADLVISEATVKTHVGKVLAKLDARDRVQAVVTAYDAGVVGAEPLTPS